MVIVRWRRAFLALAATFALLLALPQLGLPLGREAAVIDAYARLSAEGHAKAFDAPAVATPGAMLASTLGRKIASTPGRGVRVVTFISVFALGLAASLAFRPRTPAQVRPPNIEVVILATVAASWFSNVFFDVSSSGRGELIAHAALLGSIALVGSSYRREAAACGLFAIAFAFAPEVVGFLPIVAYLAKERAGTKRSGIVVAMFLASAGLVLVSYYRWTGAWATSTVAFAPDVPFPSAVAQLFFHFRPTGAAVVCVTVLELSLRPSPRTRGPGAERNAAWAYVATTTSLAALPWLTRTAQLESVVGAFAVLVALASAPRDWRSALHERWPWLAAVTIGLSFLGFAAAASNPATKSHGNRATGSYVRRIKDALSTGAGLAPRSRPAWLASLQRPYEGFFPDETEAIGSVLDADGREGTILVTVDAPEIYAATRRLPAVRAFATAPMPVGTEVPFPPPRWLVTDPRSNPPKGFRKRALFTHFMVLVREDP